MQSPKTLQAESKVSDRQSVVGVGVRTMDWSWWFRRRLLQKNNPPNPHQPKLWNQQQEEEEKLLGVTEQLIDHVKSFTLDTFKNFALQEHDETPSTSSANVRNDLSQWQERHATLVLSKVKELAQLRFMLCPCHLKEQQFWKIYFMLVKTHVAEYELQAIRLAKLKSMAMENEKSSDTGAFEVEMAEARQAEILAPPTP